MWLREVLYETWDFPRTAERGSIIFILVIAGFRGEVA